MHYFAIFYEKFLMESIQQQYLAMALICHDPKGYRVHGFIIATNARMIVALDSRIMLPRIHGLIVSTDIRMPPIRGLIVATNARMIVALDSRIMLPRIHGYQIAADSRINSYHEFMEE